MGLHLTGVFAALGISAVAMAVAATIVAAKHVQKIPAIAGQTVVRNLSFDRVWKLSGVTYLRDLSLYFATPAFASPALLGVLGSPQPVALFATSYFVASSAVTLAVSGFRGIYRPAFARVLVAGERADLQRAFDVMTKVQILAVVPAGFGLGVMVADYLPLLYGAPFEAAVPIARVLIALLFAETALAIALVVLWSDEQYGPVLAAHAVLIVGAPLFVWTAGQFGLLAAAAVLGGSRLAASAIGHVAAVRRYEVRYPWQFAMKVVLVSSGMAAVLLVLRHAWGSSLIEAAVLTLAGVVMVLVGLRGLRVIEAAEIELLERARVPGGAWIARWLEGSNASAPRERREVRND
jgi:O-antigen/teichoic acid export membrane protein